MKNIQLYTSSMQIYLYSNNNFYLYLYFHFYPTVSIFISRLKNNSCVNFYLHVDFII
jgi:hypothetical protein